MNKKEIALTIIKQILEGEPISNELAMEAVNELLASCIQSIERLTVTIFGCPLKTNELRSYLKMRSLEIWDEEMNTGDISEDIPAFVQRMTVEANKWGMEHGTPPRTFK